MSHMVVEEAETVGKLGADGTVDQVDIKEVKYLETV